MQTAQKVKNAYVAPTCHSLHLQTLPTIHFSLRGINRIDAYLDQEIYLASRQKVNIKMFIYMYASEQEPRGAPEEDAGQTERVLELRDVGGGVRRKSPKGENEGGRGCKTVSSVADLTRNSSWVHGGVLAPYPYGNTFTKKKLHSGYHNKSTTTEKDELDLDKDLDTFTRLIRRRAGHMRISEVSDIRNFRKLNIAIRIRIQNFGYPEIRISEISDSYSDSNIQYPKIKQKDSKITTI
ncbi:hypothetical protein LXL04_012385 [Taraxacum kok-saghyz]